MATVKGDNCSHYGTILFPAWECNVPSLGMKDSHVGNKNGALVGTCFAVSGGYSERQIVVFV